MTKMSWEVASAYALVITLILCGGVWALGKYYHSRRADL